MLVSEEYYEESLMYVFLATGHIDELNTRELYCSNHGMKWLKNK